jgi:hypothetical protein
MFSALPADCWRWIFGAGLSFIFLWLISAPPVRDEQEQVNNWTKKGKAPPLARRQTRAARAKDNDGNQRRSHRGNGVAKERLP